jgi:hypothetical protein
MIRVDFHCHTEASKDSLTSPAALLAAAQKMGLHRVAVTDHNSIRGALRAKELNPRMVIVGEEIKTTQGEILAFFVEQEIPRGLPPLEVISRLRAQGAFISVSHPFDVHRSGGWLPSNLEKIAPLVDAIEIFNARCLSPRYNAQAAQFAAAHPLPGTAGSDAHIPWELGAACLLLPDFCDAESLRAAVRQAKVQGRLSPWWIHLTSTWARWVKKLRA